MQRIKKAARRRRILSRKLIIHKCGRMVRLSASFRIICAINPRPAQRSLCLKGLLPPLITLLAPYHSSKTMQPVRLMKTNYWWKLDVKQSSSCQQPRAISLSVEAICWRWLIEITVTLGVGPRAARALHAPLDSCRRAPEFGSYRGLVTRWSTEGSEAVHQRHRTSNLPPEEEAREWVSILNWGAHPSGF